YGDKEKEIELTVTFEAKQELTDPVAGFSIKNAADDTLFGTNSTIKRQKLGIMKAGDTRTVRWTMPNILADGRHYVTPSVERSDGVTVCDWWPEATTFAVRKSEETAYAITPNIELKILKDK